MKKTHHERRVAWADILVICVISIFILGAGILLFLSQDNMAHSPSKNKDHTTSVLSTVDTIDSNYPGIKIITEVSNDLEIPFAIQYPQSTHVAFNETIKSYIKKGRKELFLRSFATFSHTIHPFFSSVNKNFKLNCQII